ncbi:hypothetical protein Bbelb_282560 [Branchiostoma belcheri]|nr:hypothetical protein Bbelb_282560 [Branchiostoma belcheri]
MLMGDADGTTTKDMMTALLDHYLYTIEQSTSRQDLSPADILVNSDDIQDLQDRFTQKVKAVLVEHFQSLEKFKDTFRKPSSPFPVKKSVVIPLPLEDKDEYKKADTIEILLTFARELNLGDCMKDRELLCLVVHYDFHLDPNPHTWNIHELDGGHGSISTWPKAGQKGGGAVIPCKIRVQVKDKGKTLAALMAAFSDFGPEKTVLTLL